LCTCAACTTPKPQAERSCLQESKSQAAASLASASVQRTLNPSSACMGAGTVGGSVAAEAAVAALALALAAVMARTRLVGSAAGAVLGAAPNGKLVTAAAPRNLRAALSSGAGSGQRCEKGSRYFQRRTAKGRLLGRVKGAQPQASAAVRVADLRQRVSCEANYLQPTSGRQAGARLGGSPPPQTCLRAKMTGQRQCRRRSAS
jgi:hypothetical protein